MEVLEKSFKLKIMLLQLGSMIQNMQQIINSTPENVAFSSSYVLTFM